MKIKLLYCLLIYALIGCGRQNTEKIENINNKNVFINEVGTYYYKEYVIHIKQFKDGSLIYGIFGLLRNECLYQQNLTDTFSNYSKWTLYIDDKDKIWFYNSDRNETSVMYHKDKEVVFESHKNKLPPIPKKLEEFIKS